MSDVQDRKLTKESRGWADPFHAAVHPWDLSGPTGSSMIQGLSDKDHKERPPKVMVLGLFFGLKSWIGSS